MTVQACFYKSDAVIYLNVAIILLCEDKERKRSQHYLPGPFLSEVKS